MTYQYENFIGQRWENWRIGGSRNIILPLKDESHDKWIGKIFDISEGVMDACNRENLAYTFASTVLFPIPEVKIVKPSKEIDKWDEIKDQILNDATNLPDWFKNDNNIEQCLNKDMMLSKWKGSKLFNDFIQSNKLADITNLNIIIQGFVFNYWFGNFEGNMGANVVIDNTNKGWFFDFGSSGPGHSSYKISSNIINDQNFDNTSKYSDLLPEQLFEYLRAKMLDNGLEILREMISRIEALSDSFIKDVVAENGPFYWQGSDYDNLNSLLSNELVRRKNELRNKVETYLVKGSSIRRLVVKDIIPPSAKSSFFCAL